MKSNSLKSYCSLSTGDQIADVIANAVENCGLVIENPAAYKNAIATDIGRAMKDGAVSQRLWKVVSTVPVSSRKNDPRLVGYGALEELMLARFRAECAVNAWNASDIAMS